MLHAPAVGDIHLRVPGRTRIAFNEQGADAPRLELKRGYQADRAATHHQYWNRVQALSPSPHRAPTGRCTHGQYISQTLVLVHIFFPNGQFCGKEHVLPGWLERGPTTAAFTRRLAKSRR